MERTHREVVELMPWYVNGTLTGPERAGVEKHVNECLPCRAALREQQRMRSLVSAQDDVPVSAGHGVSDLLRKIDHSDAGTTRGRLRPQFGFGVAVAGIAVAGWLALLVSRPEASAVDTSAPFTTLIDSASLAPDRIDVVFVETVTAAEIRELIDSLGARMIGGPSDLGRYTIAVGSASDEALSAVIDRLAQDPRVRFVGRSFAPSPPTEPESR